MGAMIFIYAVAWFGLSLLLPHRDAPWTALLPGAAIVAVGLEGLHLVTVYYLSRKVSTSSDLYGPVGAAIGILLWAYLFGRLTVAAAVFNATLWHRRPEPQSAPSSIAELAEPRAEERDDGHD
jgi:membrane protein